MTESPFIQLEAVILVGGRSRRMGRDKALLDMCGEPMWQRQFRLSVNCGARRVFLSVRPDQHIMGPAIERVVDAHLDLGPLSGLASSLANCRGTHLLALAVDMPLLEENLIRHMISQCAPERGIVPYVDGNPQPVSAIYTRRCLDEAIDRLGRNALAAGDWADACVRSGFCLRWDVPDRDARLFDNWNVPGDLPKTIRQENGGL